MRTRPGAVIGAILFEGWASTPARPRVLADRRRRDHLRAVPPTTGRSAPWRAIVSPSMPVVVVENVTAGNRAFATLNEGLGKVLRFGAYDASVLDRLRWMAEHARAGARPSARAGGPIDLKRITAQALQMGDECHNRNVAATSLFTRAIAPALVRTVDGPMAVGRPRLPARQRPLLPESVDGRLQGDSGRRARG